MKRAYQTGIESKDIPYGYGSDEDPTYHSESGDPWDVEVESSSEEEDRSVRDSRELTMKALLKLSASVKEYPQPLSYYEDIADSFREAIRLDPKNSKAIYHLAMTYAEYNIRIKASDLVETRFEGVRPDKVRRSELVAELQRKVLRLDPNDIYAIMQLAFAISNKVQIQPVDLKGTLFQGRLRVNPSELEAALYRRVIALDPKYGEAYYYLGLLFEEEGIEIQDQDLDRRKYGIGGIDRTKIAAEYYRKVIELKPSFEAAYRHLAYCLRKGAPIAKSDLTLLKLDKPASVEAVMLALFRKAIAVNPKDSVSLYHLASFILKGAIMKEEDFEGTSLARCDGQHVRKIDLAAAIYRKAITYNPKYYLAMQRLDECLKLQNGAEQEKGDEELLKPYRLISYVQRLVARADALYENEDEPISQEDRQALILGEQDVSSLPRQTLITKLYKKAYSIDRDCIQAMLGVARGIESSRSEKAAELYRKVISIEPRNSTAFYRLAFCIAQQNVIIQASDLNLLGTKFEMYSPQTVDRNQLAIALLAQAVMLDPSDETLVKELKACIPADRSVEDYLVACGYKLQPNKTYCPLMRVKLQPVVVQMPQSSTTPPAKLR